MTAPDADVARSLGRQLVESDLCAGVNIIPGAISIYHWQGEICERQEWLLLAQASQDALPNIFALIGERHPYVTPCALAWPAPAGLEPFLRWIAANSQGQRQGAFTGT